jgi:hypothetical protein
VEQEEWPSTFAATVISSMRSRAIGGWSVLGSLPTRPGHMALCSFMVVGVGVREEAYFFFAFL